MRGQLTTMSKEWSTGQFLVTFRVNNVRGLEGLAEKELDITVKPHKDKRSLAQNDLYWSIVYKVAPRLGLSVPELHNQILGEWGQPLEVDGQIAYVFLPDDKETERRVAMDDRVHLKVTNRISSKGLRVYVLLRGSSTYDTAEMSRLVDGIIEKANEADIDWRE